jgi:CHAT domain-containing protein
VRGREVGGEGGIALVSAFRRAGAGAVVLGLWTVPEAAASNLLPKFYQLLDAGETPAEALRSAKLSLLQAGGADPISWAPFLLFD